MKQTVRLFIGSTGSSETDSRTQETMDGDAGSGGYSCFLKSLNEKDQGNSHLQQNEEH